MTDTTVLHLGLQAMILAAKLAGPILLVTLVIGFVVSVFQSMTQIQEMSLSFVPKLLGVALVLLVAGRWMLAELVTFTTRLFDSLPQLLSGS